MSNSTASATLLHQTGVLGGRNPIVYSTSDPLTLFLVQAFIILVLCRLIHWPLSYINQPRVIAEVIAGILLSPSVMGHVPNFTQSIFPTASIPNLTVAADIGLIMFLFIVGLEVDMPYVLKNLKLALTVGFLSLLIPFALGWAVAVGIYKQYANQQAVSFGVYGLFVAVALSITALPVLARILTELQLLNERVGVIVLSAGICNDLVGWILLALTITLANSSKGINAFYIVLLIVAWFLLQVFAVRPVLKWYLKKSKGLENGPSQFDIAIIILLIIVSSFYTDIIGVHPIFGAFIIGIIVPRDNDFVIKLIEKIDDFISVFLLPLYFALAGLSVNLGLLNNGTVWGYVIAIIAIAFSGKVFGGTVAAKFNGLLWRESFSVGILMSCKGIVEIVVLTLGLNAGILTPEVFSMFMVMTLVTTFLTSPLTLLVYPASYRQKVQKWRNKEINWDGTPIASGEFTTVRQPTFGKLVVFLNDFEAIAVVMSFVRLISPNGVASPGFSIVTTPIEDLKNDVNDNNDQILRVEGVRLVDLSQRTGDLIQATVDAEELGAKDAILNVVKIVFTQINKTSFIGKLGITLPRDRASFLVNNANDSGNTNDVLLLTCKDESLQENFDFYSEIFYSIRCQVSLFIDRGFNSDSHYQQIYLPYFGNEGDKLALSFALKISDNNSQVRVTIDVVSSTIFPATEDDDSRTVRESETWNYVSQVLHNNGAAYNDRVILNRLDLFNHEFDNIDFASRANNAISSENGLVLIGNTLPPLSDSSSYSSRNYRNFLNDVTTAIVSDQSITASILICQSFEQVK